MTNQESVTQGASEALWDFLIDRDVTVVDAIRDGAHAAVRDWLTAHTDEVLAAVSQVSVIREKAQRSTRSTRSTRKGL